MGRQRTEAAEYQPVGTLRRLLGDEIAGRFHDAFAGMSVYIPVSVRATHPIAKAIGLEAAQALSAECGGVRYEIPNNRERRAAALFHEGKTIGEIAFELRITERGASRILSRLGLSRRDYLKSSTGA